MATILNERDKLLQAYSPRILQTTSITNATVATFTKLKNVTTVTPSSTSLVATYTGFGTTSPTPTITWAYASSAYATSWTSILDASNDFVNRTSTYSLLSSTFDTHRSSSSSVTYRVTISQTGWTTAQSYITVTYLQQSDDAPVISISRPAIVVPFDASGTASYTSTETSISVSIGSSVLTYGTSGANTFDVSASVNAGSVTIGSKTNNSFGNISGFSGTAATIRYTINVRDSAAVARTYTIDQSVTKAASGAVGAPGLSLSISGGSRSITYDTNSVNPSPSSAGTFTLTLVGGTATGYSWSSYISGTSGSGSASSFSPSIGSSYNVGSSSYVTCTVTTSTGSVSQTIPISITKTGATGSPGTSITGPSGATAVYAYKVVSGTSLPTAPSIPSGAATNGSAVTGGGWYTSPKATLASDDWQFMASGTNLSGVYTWTSPSYLATFKVGKLSALSADMGSITSGTMVVGTGSTPRGGTIEITSTGVFWSDNIFSKIGIFGNNSGSSGAIRGVSENGCSGEGVYGLAAVSNTVAHGVRGQNITKGTSGFVGGANGYNFYADGTGSIGDYGTFTGAHDALLLIGHIVVPGDILVDKLVVSKGNISNTISEVVISSIASQKGVVGVYTGSLGVLSEQLLPNALLGSRTYITHLDGEKETVNTPVSIYDSIKDSYEYVVMNSLGEGQINVCGEGGNIEIGDLIVSSSIPGKGMKQDNDTIYSYTVAKSRENIVFSSNIDIRMVACIYLCG